MSEAKVSCEWDSLMSEARGGSLRFFSTNLSVGHRWNIPGAVMLGEIEGGMPGPSLLTHPVNHSSVEFDSPSPQILCLCSDCAWKQIL